MPFWLGASLGAMTGLVTGIVLVSLAMSNDMKEWAKPDVVGPTVGAFLAAMVGVGGAMWAHQEEQRSRTREKAEREREATSKVFTACLELVGAVAVMVREIERMSTEGEAQPHLQDAVYKLISAIAQEVHESARNPDLHSRVAADARNISRIFVSMEPAIKLDPTCLENIAPTQTVNIGPNDRRIIGQAVPVYQAQLKAIIGKMKDWDSWYRLIQRDQDIEATIAWSIEQSSSMLKPLYTF